MKLSSHVCRLQDSAFRARLGLIVLQSDESLEYEGSRWLAALGDDSGAIALYHTRIPNEDKIDRDSLARMADRLVETAALLPRQQALDVIGYGCTSASAVIGSDGVAERVQRTHPGVPVTNPFAAVSAALTALGAQRIAILSPYEPTVSQTVRERLAEDGHTVACIGSFHEDSDFRVARIDPQSIYTAAGELIADTGVDTVFISCTNLRVAPVIDAIEGDYGVSVVSSNQALLWHMLRLAGIHDAIPDMGRLGALNL